MVKRLGWTVLFVLAAGCGDTTEPVDQGVPEEQLRFLRFPADLATPATTDTTFWAVRGEDRQLVLRYEPEPGQDPLDAGEFLEFRVREKSLYRRPDGTLFEDGDSVEIRVTLDPEGRFLFRFEPSGLEFTSEDPAELEIEYLRLDGDLDDDGDVDTEDDEFEQQMRIWKQELPGDPWFPVGTIKIEELDEIRGEIGSFTGFAIAV